MKSKLYVLVGTGKEIKEALSERPEIEDEAYYFAANFEGDTHTTIYGPFSSELAAAEAHALFVQGLLKDPKVRKITLVRTMKT